MKKIIYSAPAKVILSGEHAVVYGKPALVSAINLRFKFNLWKKQDSNNHLNNDRDLNGNIEFINNLIRKFLNKGKSTIVKNKSYQYKIESDIPIGRGLGSSAALSVTATAAFLEFFSSKEYPPKTINNLAHEVEKRFHRNSSGVDTTASCFGGLIYYRKELEFLKNISVLDYKIPKKIEEKLFLVDSGEPKETTAEMVAYVGFLLYKKSKLVLQVLNDIERITKKMVMAIVKQDNVSFKQTISANEKLLEKIGVVSSETKKLLSNLSNFGVGKITGAGGKKNGSGFLLFYADDVGGLKKYCQTNKISYFKFSQSSTGATKLN